MQVCRILEARVGHPDVQIFRSPNIGSQRRGKPDNTDKKSITQTVVMAMAVVVVLAMMSNNDGDGVWSWQKTVQVAEAEIGVCLEKNSPNCSFARRLSRLGSRPSISWPLVLGLVSLPGR